MSESDKTFNFYINGETRGPLTEAEARSLIATGEITPKTLCAPVGAADWEPASNHLNFDGAVSAASASRAAASLNSNVERGDDSNIGGPELSPILRKKLIKLGLATATTIDNFSEGQATAAIAEYETSVRKAKKTRIFSGIGGFAGGALAMLLLGFTSLGADISGGIAGKFVKESEQYEKARKNISNDFRQLDTAQRELETTKLREPDGATPGARLKDRIKIPEKRRNLLRVKVNFDNLIPALRKKPRILYFRQLSSDIKKQMRTQLESALKYKNPEKLAERLEDVELAASWALFKKECGTLIPDYVKANQISSVEVEDNETGEWRIEGRQTSNLAIAIDLRLADSDTEPFTVYLPIDTAQSLSLSPSDWFELEQYVVLDKRSLGGKAYGISGNFQGCPYFLEKNTPYLYYLRMRPEELPQAAPIWVRVSGDLFQKTEVGALIPTKKLVEFPFYTLESPREYNVQKNLRFKEEVKR